MTPRRRWCARALAIVTLGLAPVIVTDELPTGWALIWLLVCCAVALLQPGPVHEPRSDDAHAPEVRWIRAGHVAHAEIADADYTRIGTSA
jgi:hypothetical protein